jgi:hypothetical protein
MINSTQPLSEPVVPRSGPERLSQTPPQSQLPRSQPPHAEGGAIAAEIDNEFVLTPGRILRAALRIGKSFELVFECCVL